MYLRRLLICSFALLFVFVLGCGTGLDSTSSGSSDSTDEEIIKGAVDNTYFPLFSTGVVEDDTGESAGGAVTLPVNEDAVEDDSIPLWFRRVHVTSRDISVHIEGDTADVSVTTDIEGDFLIDTDGDFEFGRKEIRATAVRYATFQRDYDFPGRHWRLSSISPVEINLQDEENRTISIKSVKAYVDGELRWEVYDYDPATLFKVPSELPRFAPGEEVVVTADIENLNSDGSERGSYVYLHYTTHEHRRGMANHGSRRLMYDDGTHGDETAGDGIFTGTYIIGDAMGYHHAAVDVLDKEMFSDETTQNYNSMAWAMPYVVNK
ncbi:MAG: hypothetical protein GXP46_10360 [Deferribacteres bacterium]|nr:hypothetical protein [Deferribacteres bacterium]